MQVLIASIPAAPLNLVRYLADGSLAARTLMRFPWRPELFPLTRGGLRTPGTLFIGGI